MMSQNRMALWTWLSPAIAWLILAIIVITGIPPMVVAVAVIALFATVFAAVHHAEVVAHRVGEPFGTLVLAVAVTIIEVALIVSVMAGGADKAALARDTVFAAVMIVCNGIVGLCLLVGGLRHREQGFQLQGASAALVVLAALTTLTMILPNVTTTVRGPVFSTPQLIFVAIVSLILYGAFIFIQTIRHRDYFLAAKADGEDAHEKLPSDRTTLASAGLLCAALVAVVGLAKALTPSVDATIASFGMPASLSGIIIATLVLLPEGLAALRAAQANRLQTEPLNPCAWIIARDHRPDDPDRRRCFDLVPDAARARAWREGDSAARADPVSWRDHLGYRADNHASRDRASRHFRGIPVLCDLAVIAAELLEISGIRRTCWRALLMET